MDKFIQNTINRLMEKVKALKYADEDWGQMDFWITTDEKPSRHPTKFPCALIEIESVSYTNNSRLQQAGQMRVNIRYFALRLSNSSIGAPDNQKAKNGEVWRDIREINSALHGWNPATNYGRMQRGGFARHKRDDGVRAFQLSYSLIFTDDTTTRYPQGVDTEKQVIVNNG